MAGSSSHYTHHTKHFLSLVAACSCAVVIVGFIGGAFAAYPSLADQGSDSRLATQVPVSANVLPTSPTSGERADLATFWQLWSILQDHYYQQPVKNEALLQGAMAGLAQSLNDPYTTYFNPKTAKEFQQSLESKVEGIGVEIDVRNGQLQIISPLPNSPAEKNGILAGDLIFKIDGKNTTEMNAEQARSLIRGPKGTKVTLLMSHVGQKAMPYEVEITREEVHYQSVEGKKLPGQIAYIKIASFNEDTPADFTATLNNLLKQSPKGIVLDLRNDPGGYVDTALQITGEWVGDQPVVKEWRQGKMLDQLIGSGSGRLHGTPTIILVNQGSASASEIVAGALQDYGEATVVGSKTFGKGSVQEYDQLQDGSAIKVTIAEWSTPRDRFIDKKGIEPDITVERTPEDYTLNHDPQLEKALELLKQEK